jgi:hypothetical protein
MQKSGMIRNALYHIGFIFVCIKKEGEKEKSSELFFSLTLGSATISTALALLQSLRFFLHFGWKEDYFKAKRLVNIKLSTPPCFFYFLPLFSPLIQPEYLSPLYNFNSHHNLLPRLTLPCAISKVHTRIFSLGTKKKSTLENLQ